MEDMAEGIFDLLLQNYELYLVLVMGALMTFIMLLLNLLKKPIKHFTSKIQNEKLRKLANKSIILLSFVIAIVAWLILAKTMPTYFSFDWVQILLTGSLPIVVYSLYDGVINTAKAQFVVQAIKEVAGDKQVTKDELKFMAKVIKQTISANESADDEFAKLIANYLKKGD